jgi:ribosomal protein L16 Arg81 hydroxylase
MSYLTIDETTFLDQFPKRHFRISHSLMDHPLLSLESLQEMADRHPPYLAEYWSGKAAVVQDPQTTPHTGLSLSQTMRDMAKTDSWVVLKYLEIYPEYEELLHAIIDELRPLSRKRGHEAKQLESYIFISSPGSVTPFHMDDEHNFLLQISGSKTFHAWTLDHPEIIGTSQLETYYGGGHRNLHLPDESESPDIDFELAPGDGIFVPIHSPHWVKNGDAVSISLSVTFRSAQSIRDAHVHFLNAKLRRRGYSPRPCGESSVGDFCKYWAARLGQRFVGRPQHY